VHGEDTETEFGRLYGQVNFLPRPGFLPTGWQPKIEPGTEFQLLDYEVEYIGRWGNSTGQTVDDWHVSNLTDRRNAGSSGWDAPGGPDWRQSCIDAAGCHPSNPGFPNSPPPQPSAGTESNKGVPYGTKLTTTLGAPNYITGDFNKDGEVNMADYVVWRDTLNQPMGNESNHPAADANHDFLVTYADYLLWKANFGAPEGAASGARYLAAAAFGVPEPSSWAMAALAITTLALCPRRS
jgi:hypothetical protein